MVVDGQHGGRSAGSKPSWIGRPDAVGKMMTASCRLLVGVLPSGGMLLLPIRNLPFQGPFAVVQRNFSAQPRHKLSFQPKSKYPDVNFPIGFHSVMVANDAGEFREKRKSREEHELSLPS